MTTPSDAPAFPWRAWMGRVPRVALAVLALILMAQTERFFSLRNLSNILNLASLVGVLALGQAFVLIGGGFDLSQGAVLGLSAACAATWLDGGAVGPVVAGLGALAIGAGVGAANGAMVAYVRTNPFVTTLSATLIVRGLTFLRLGGRQVGNVGGFAALAADLSPGGLRVSVLGLIFLGAIVLAWVVLRRTVFGQHVYAVGGNAEAARLAGVRTTRVTLSAFALSGLAAGVAALMWLAFVRVAKADSGQGYELNAIAACVVGGVSLQGGRGSILGAAAGCLLLQALSNLITLGGYSDEYSTLVTGAVILTFAAADAFARRGERTYS